VRMMMEQEERGCLGFRKGKWGGSIRVAGGCGDGRVGEQGVKQKAASRVGKGKEICIWVMVREGQKRSAGRNVRWGGKWLLATTGGGGFKTEGEQARIWGVVNQLGHLVRKGGLESVNLSMRPLGKKLRR